MTMSDQGVAGYYGDARGAAYDQWGAGDGASLPAAGLENLCDLMSFGIALVSTGRELLYANREARHRLAAQPGLHVQAGGLIGASRELQEMLEASIAVTAGGSRAYRDFVYQGCSCHVAFVPLGAAYEGPHPVVAMIFEKGPANERLSNYFFASTYQLTNSEERVLDALARGASAAQTAAELGTSIHTARTHIRSILSKTGQGSLRQLVARLGRVPPVGACPTGPGRSVSRSNGLRLP
jgi:DNA-binding CsgD family transcriptional regulator